MIVVVVVEVVVVVVVDVMVVVVVVVVTPSDVEDIHQALDAHRRMKQMRTRKEGNSTRNCYRCRCMEGGGCEKAAIDQPKVLKKQNSC